MLRLTVLALLPILALPPMASAQVRGAPGEKRMMLRNASGRPCLTLRSQTRKEIVNPENYQHLVTIENNCYKTIISNVCYKSSSLSCKQVRTRPYTQETVLLGVRAGYPQFDFEYDERYEP